MSRESLATLNTQTLIGFTAQRGHAWYYRREEQGGEPNHYDGAVPVADVKRRLFNWHAVPGEITATYVGQDEVEHTILVPDRQLIIRDDSGAVLGVFKEGYRIHQYEDWLIDNVSVMLSEGLQIGSAGLLRNGARAWVQVEAPENVQGPGEIEYRPFLLAATSHDGSIATTYQRGTTLVICDNTLAYALSQDQEQRVKIRHTLNSKLQIASARDALSLIETTIDETSAELERLVNTRVSDEQWQEIVARLAPIPSEEGRAKAFAETRNAALATLWRDDPRVAPWRGTLFGVLQAANTYRHHVGIIRGAGSDPEAQQRLRAARNMEATLMGTGATEDRKTLRIAEAVLA
jgi:phage/plasmid-like protein (TIGR03299 family)